MNRWAIVGAKSGKEKGRFRGSGLVHRDREFVARRAEGAQVTN
jgi:hypothetical protein